LSVGSGVDRPASVIGGVRKAPGLDVARREWLRDNDDTLRRERKKERQ
jgi:hypothetical protein